MWKKLLFSALALAALAAAYVRPAYSVELDGRPLPGLWSGAALRDGLETARAAAEELSRGGAAVSEPETRLRLSLRPAEGTAAELAAALLADTPGVELAWRVSVDGVDIGLAADRSAFEETVLAYIAERAPAESLSTSLASELELRGVFIPEGRATPLAELTGRLRALTAVAYVAADGQTRFA